MLAQLLYLLLLLIILLCFYNFYYKRKDLPPGPIPLPIIGNVHTVFRCAAREDVFLRWRNQYGPIYTYWLGELPVVCVTEYKRMVELFQRDGDTYAGRWDFREFGAIALDGRPGVIWTEGELWREHRRFTIHALREFGLGKNIMQERVLVEIEALVGKIQADMGAGLGDQVNVVHHLDISVGSIINSLLFGYRFDEQHEKKFYELKALLDHLTEFAFNPTLGFTLLMLKPEPLRRLPYFRSVMERFMTMKEALMKFFYDEIAEHIRVLEKSGSIEKWDTPPTDYVHAFLKEKAKIENTGKNGGGQGTEGEGPRHDFSTFTMDQLRGTCFDIWIAGQETATTTLCWGLVYLIANPQYQTQLHEELDRVIGSPQQWITVAERPHLHFTCACIAEIQRYANIVPTNFLRSVTHDTMVDGYHLATGTAVMPQISSVLMDPTIFKDPYRFDPTRHLDAGGRFQRRNELIPYSIGKRQCLGESLAQMELFLFLANMFNRFRFSANPAHPMPKEKSKYCAVTSGVLAFPQFVCRVESRRER